MTEHRSTTATTSTLTEADAISLLRGRDLGRLSIDIDGYPIALPVNYAVELRPRAADRIIIRAAPASVIGSYAGPASVEVDHLDLDRGAAWSVLVRGDLGRVRGRRPALDPDPFVADGRTRWMQLEVREVDGRRFAVGGPGRASGRAGGDEATGAGDERPAAWLNRLVTAAAGSVREQIERLHAVVAPSGSLE